MDEIIYVLACCEPEYRRFCRDAQLQPREARRVILSEPWRLYGLREATVVDVVDFQCLRSERDQRRYFETVAILNGRARTLTEPQFAQLLRGQ